MSDIRVVLLVLALAPGLGFAQSVDLAPPPLIDAEEVGPEAAAETPAVDEALPSRVAPAVEWKQDPPERVMGRVLLESLGGTLGGVGGGLAGLLAMLPLGDLAMGCSGDACDGRPMVAGAVVGWSLGTAIGVYGSGALLGGRGRFLPTLGLGLLAGGASAALYMSRAVGDETVPLMLLLPLVTSIVTYEVTAASGPPRAKTLAASRATGAWWTPTVGLSPSGGSLGLTGRF
ncbi:hypothetical protein [Pyxidicoccus trucidator]|uniref:hypothetical protein n=1 Tax=Pyxidicoccus trucidator TaxID=2709662 RepID=UPI0013DBD77E|nr:hypothetical protein [Pyxidicoccus trucidator]